MTARILRISQKKSYCTTLLIYIAITTQHFAIIPILILEFLAINHALHIWQGRDVFSLLLLG